MSKKELTKKVRIQIYVDGKRFLEKSFSKGPIVFGRLPTSNVVLDFTFVSRQHCQLIEEHGNLFLVDLKSRNGIFVNEQPVERQLVEGSLDFTIDKLKISVQVSEKSQFDFSEVTSPSVSVKTVIHGKVPQHPVTQAAVKGPVPQPKPSSPQTSAAHASASAALLASAQRSGKTLIPPSKGKSPAKLVSMDHQPLIEKSFEAELLGPHPGLAHTNYKKLEAVVMWKDQVYEVREFEPHEKVTVGSSLFASLRIPTIPRGWSLAHVDMSDARCYVPKDKPFGITRGGARYDSQSLAQAQQVKATSSGYLFRLSHQDIVDVDCGHDVKVVLRYIPGQATLTKKKLTEPDYAIKQALLGSLIVHGLLALAIIIAAPKPKNVPKLKDVPERFARLLVEPPKPILPVPVPIKPPPPPEPEPPKRELVKQKPQPKKQAKIEKPQPKKFEQPKKLEQQNKFPLVVKNPQPVTKPVAPTKVVAQPSAQPTPQPVKEAPPVKVESLGALAALGALSNDPNAGPPAPNIQINKDAGGAASKVPNTSGIVGALPSASGKLVAAGSGPIKTGGKGIGSGTAYGTQGLGAGGAGTRGVAGAIVGQPVLAGSGGKTEGLTRQQVMSIVQKHLGEIQHCYEKSLLGNPGLAGRMEFEWDIESTGTVSAVRVKRSTVNGGDSLGECVKSVFSKMKFPTAKNGQSTTPNIGFPFGRL
ncbi:MAG: AgmX/PglI C-terminal domain-containing protein [Pseudobdellovibrionaceae bacterium]